MAGRLEAGKNAVLFYDDERLLEEFLFQYVKAGLNVCQPVIYLAGIRTVEQVRHAMSKNGIDPDSHNLSIMRYDDVFLKDGKFDPYRVHSTLFKQAHDLRALANSHHVRLATESNWWFLTDLFEQGLEMEEQHDLVPSYLSIVCTYNIVDLLKNVSVYHLARLADMHEDAFVISNRAQVGSVKFRVSLHGAIMEAVDELFEPAVVTRDTRFKPASDLLEYLQSKVGAARMVELEKRVEDRLFKMLNQMQ
jgi:hypothetical protein